MKVFFKPTLIKDFKKLPLAIRREVHSIGVEIFTKLRDIQNGPVAHLARARAWHARGKEFESPRVHHIELVASLGASPLASAGSFASKSKGFLKSISSRSAARRRFTNKICIAQRAMSRFFSFAASERQSEILLNCRCGVSFFNYN